MIDVTDTHGFDICHIIICFNAVLGKPANTMDKYNIDWFPTLELGHDKLDVAAVHAASERTSEREAQAKVRYYRHALIYYN